MRFSGNKIRQVTLQQRTVSYDDYNQPVESWTDTTIYAEKWERQGKEGVEGGQIIAVADVRWKIRYKAGINEKDFRIKEGSTIYDIQNIQDIGRNEGHWLMCERRDRD